MFNVDGLCSRIVLFDLNFSEFAHDSLYDLLQRVRDEVRTVPFFILDKCNLLRDSLQLFFPPCVLVTADMFLSDLFIIKQRCRIVSELHRQKSL